MITDIERVASLVADLGPLTTDWTPARLSPGGPARPARLWIRTSIERDPSHGGGVVQWLLVADVGGNSDHIDHLNAIVGTLASCLGAVGRVAATVRNAYQDKRRAEAAEHRAEVRLAEVLRGSGREPRGEFLIRREMGGPGAWLLDPVKGDAGLGFRYTSLDALWRDNPSLRPVRWEGGDLIVAPMALEAPDAR